MLSVECWGMSVKGEEWRVKREQDQETFATEYTESTEKSILLVRANPAPFVAAGFSRDIRRSRIKDSAKKNNVECWMLNEEQKNLFATESAKK